MRREKHDRHISLPKNAFGSFRAIHATPKIDVHENQIQLWGFAHGFYGFLTAGHGLDRIPVLFELHLLCHCDKGFVFHEEDRLLSRFGHEAPTAFLIQCL